MIKKGKKVFLGVHQKENCYVDSFRLPGHGAVSHSAISESKGAGHSYPPLVGGIQSRCLDIVPTLAQSPMQSLHSPQKDHLKLVVSGPVH